MSRAADLLELIADTVLPLLGEPGAPVAVDRAARADRVRMTARLSRECAMGKIVCVHSFRGGTGKSNRTATLSTTRALGGRRVGIVDTDIQSPGIHVIFNLNETRVTRALNDYLWGRCESEETAYDLTPAPLHEAGGTIYLIPSSINAGEIARILREGYDVERLTEGFQPFTKTVRELARRVAECA
jgi:hypothetical protein